MLRRLDEPRMVDPSHSDRQESADHLSSSFLGSESILGASSPRVGRDVPGSPPPNGCASAGDNLPATSHVFTGHDLQRHLDTCLQIDVVDFCARTDVVGNHVCVDVFRGRDEKDLPQGRRAASWRAARAPSTVIRRVSSGSSSALSYADRSLKSRSVLKVPVPRGSGAGRPGPAGNASARLARSPRSLVSRSPSPSPRVLVTTVARSSSPRLRVSHPLAAVAFSPRASVTGLLSGSGDGLVLTNKFASLRVAVSLVGSGAGRGSDPVALSGPDLMSNSIWTCWQEVPTSSSGLRSCAWRAGSAYSQLWGSP